MARNRWTWCDSPLARARKTALLDQTEMAEKLKISVPVLVKNERHPENVKMGMLRKIYDIVPDEGKNILQDYVENFFTSVE